MPLSRGKFRTPPLSDAIVSFFSVKLWTLLHFLYAENWIGRQMILHINWQCTAVNVFLCERHHIIRVIHVAQKYGEDSY